MFNKANGFKSENQGSSIASSTPHVKLLIQ